MNADAHPSLLRVLRQGSWFVELPVALQEAIMRGSVVRSCDKGEVISLEDSPHSAAGLVELGFRRIHIPDLARLREAPEEKPSRAAQPRR